MRYSNICGVLFWLFLDSQNERIPWLTRVTRPVTTLLTPHRLGAKAIRQFELNNLREYDAVQKGMPTLTAYERERDSKRVITEPIHLPCHLPWYMKSNDM